jgi:hypothetical protein
MTGTAAQAGPATCTVTWDPLAELVVALAATSASNRFGPRYPGALRQEAAHLVPAACGERAAAELGARVVTLGVNRVVAAAMTRDLPAAADDPAARLVEEIHARADLSVVPPLTGDYVERLRSMHRESRFDGAGIPTCGRVGLWPLRLLPPAPAGKLFARNVPAGQPLRMAFGDLGHVNGNGELDWPQWYRLGVWHATMNTIWARRVAAVASAELDAAYQRLPSSHRSKAGVHEATVSTLANWPAYFLDSLVAAGKVVLEAEVGGERSAQDQRRWLRALGRVHIDWFVDRLLRTGVASADVAGLAREWLAEHAGLAAISTRFEGPLAACESPMWSQSVEVFYSPSIPRSTRRALGVWLRAQWPGEVLPGEPADFATVPGRPRLVYALTQDEPWLTALGDHVQPGGAATWASLAGAVAGDRGRALLYAYRWGSGPRTWVRVSLSSTVEGLSRLQQARTAFADWTALGTDERVRSGRIDYDERGRIAFQTP